METPNTGDALCFTRIRYRRGPRSVLDGRESRRVTSVRTKSTPGGVSFCVSTRRLPGSRKPGLFCSSGEAVSLLV